MIQPTATAPHNETQPTDTDGRLPPDQVTEQIDRLSLAQALIDVEVANARAVDLTARLTEAHAEIAALRRQVQEVQHLPATPSGATAMSSVRALVARPVKAVARRVLPLDVRLRIRQMFG